MKDRLKTLINILEVKKYLNNDLPVNEDRLKIIDVPTAEKISQSMISNPMRGGGKSSRQTCRHCNGSSVQLF